MSVLFRKITLAQSSGSLLTPRVALVSLFVIHFFGTLGLIYAPTRPYFLIATPLNLLITAALLFNFHKNWNRSFAIFAIVCWLTGFLVEVAGVHTGLIFGEYTYGPTLGLQLWDVPLIIGLNWLILIYSTGIIARQITQNLWLSSLIGSILMLLLDFFIEPVAVALDFWKWAGGEIPTHNFLGWFVTAFLLQIFFQSLNIEKKNVLAHYVFYVQLGFFISLQILI